MPESTEGISEGQTTALAQDIVDHESEDERCSISDKVEQN